MRFCRFDDDRYGVVVGDKVHDITDAVAKTLSGKKKQRWGDPMIANLAEVRAAYPAPPLLARAASSARMACTKATASPLLCGAMWEVRAAMDLLMSAPRAASPAKARSCGITGASGGGGLHVFLIEFQDRGGARVSDFHGAGLRVDFEDIDIAVAATFLDAEIFVLRVGSGFRFADERLFRRLDRGDAD